MWRATLPPDRGGSRSVFGLMIESHLWPVRRSSHAGKDQPGALEYGKSITDACLGWDDSLQSLAELSAAVGAQGTGVRRGSRAFSSLAWMPPKPPLLMHSTWSPGRAAATT
jgi:hypothetical protein